MDWFKNLKIGSKLIVMLLSVNILALIVVLVVMFTRFSSMQTDTAYRYAGEMSMNYGNQIQAELEIAMDAARTMAQTFASLKSSGIADRRTLGVILEGVLKENPAFLGTYTCWEPNALDGRDGAYVNAPGHDRTGRFIPYYNRGSGRIVLESLVDYEVAGDGDYYQIPKKTLSEAIIDPYLYTIAGKETLITSLVVPIIVGGKFLGIAGIDIALSDIQNVVAKIKPYETGVAAVFSNNGTIVGHFDQSRLGKQMRETERAMSGEHTDILADAIRKGERYNYTVYSAEMGTDIYIISSPFNVGNTKTPWSISVALPMDRVLEEVNRMKIFSFIMVIAAASFLIFIIILIARSISRPLESAVKHAEAMAELDLSKDVPDEFLNRKDEIGILSNAFQVLSTTLRETVVGIIKTTQQVATATEQIGQDNENLSQRTSEQASSLEEIAATIEESNATTKQNSDNAIEASKLTNNTLKLAENGGVIVEEAVKSIGEINASSARIADIISMINEIAFQTNLLALNAAVEAARAGDQGRGFAVVAGEVRNLAQRSGEAAKEIGVLIKDSVDKIGNGTDLVNKSGEALREIIQAVKQVNNLVSEMAAASDEQRRGIEQINTAVTEMDNMTQQNAALVEETASASEEMSSQAQELLSMVQRFNVGSAIESITDYGKSSAKRRAGMTGRSSIPAADGEKAKAAPVQRDVKKGLLDDGGYEEF